LIREEHGKLSQSPAQVVECKETALIIFFNFFFDHPLKHSDKSSQDLFTSLF
jgi:hypothetical protein